MNLSHSYGSSDLSMEHSSNCWPTPRTPIYVGTVRYTNNFFFLWKHSVISGFVCGSSSIWRRLKSLMRAEGPAAFSLCGTWRPVQCQLQPDCFNVASLLLTKAHPLHLLASFCSSLELKLCKGQGMSRLASEPRSFRSLCAHLELNRLPAWPQTP